MQDPGLIDSLPQIFDKLGTIGFLLALLLGMNLVFVYKILALFLSYFSPSRGK